MEIILAAIVSFVVTAVVGKFLIPALVRLKAGDDLSGLDILRLERAVAFEDLRMLRLIERQLTGEPSIDVSADQKRLGQPVG